MPCNTQALAAAQQVQDALDVWGPQYVDTVVSNVAATGAPTDGVSSWGTNMQNDGNNAGPPWNWVSGLAILGFTLIVSFVLSLLAQAFNVVPGLGQQISTVIQQFDSWLQNTLHNIAAPQMDGAVHILQAMFDFQLGTLAALVNISQALVYVRGQIVNDYQRLYNLSVSQAQALYNQEELNRQGGDRLIISDYQNLYNQSVSHADSDTNAERQRALAAEQQLQLQEQADTGNLKNLIDQNFFTLQQQEHADVQNLQQQIATQTNPNVNALQQQINGQILPQLIATTALATQTQTQLRTDEQQCIDPLCQNLGNLSKDFGLLNQLGIAALVIAFIAECMTQPKAVAGAINAAVTPVVDSTVTATTGL